MDLSTQVRMLPNSGWELYGEVQSHYITVTVTATGANKSALYVQAMVQRLAVDDGVPASIVIETLPQVPQTTVAT